MSKKDSYDNSKEWAFGKDGKSGPLKKRTVFKSTQTVDNTVVMTPDMQKLTPLDYNKMVAEQDAKKKNNKGFKP